MTKTDEILISGTDYLKARPDFKPAGRASECRDLQEILLQKNNNCVVLTGASGVGMTSLVMSLQAAKEDPNTPPKFLNMPFHFLDVDKLFESGDSAKIGQNFRDIRAKLSAVPGSVLFIENMGNFIDSCSKSGCSHLMNGLLGDIKKGKYQSILETPYEDLAKVIKYNSDMKANYTLKDIKEPKGDDLKAIIANAVPSLEKHHGIRISQEAAAMATMLATKHRTGALQALPSGIITLLDRALSAYALKAHMEPLRLVTLEGDLKQVNSALEGKAPGVLQAMSKEELESRRAALESDIREFKEAWEFRQTELRKTYAGNKKAQQRIAEFESRLASLVEQAQREKSTDKDAAPELLSDTPEMAELNEKIASHQQFLNDGTAKFEALTVEVNKELTLGESHVLETFSGISGVPVKKLNQSDREKIMGLKDRLNGRVFDQEHAVEKVFNAVKNAAANLKKEGKPKGCFLFLGPSGVGKTELVKALNDELFDDPNAIFRLDMSEFMEKNSTNKLIGPPPGFVGFEEGGMLTEAMQKKPIRILLVDEIEKAHPDVLNIFLQILDDARVTDGKGVTSNFEDVYIVFTSNIGQDNFPDRMVNYESAIDKSVQELKEAGVRNELLNRFGGKRNIVGFYPLEAHTMEKIVNRELNSLNKKLEESGLKINLSPEEIKVIGQDLYNPANGARSVPGFFDDEVRPKAADIILETPDAKGTLDMAYDREKKTIKLVSFNPGSPVIAPVNLQNEMQRAAQPAPRAA